MNSSWFGMKKNRVDKRARHRNRRRIAAGLFIAAMAAASLLPVTGATAAPSPRPDVQTNGLQNLPPVKPVMSCGDLVGADVSGPVGESVEIAAAVTITNDGPAPYCEVQGTIAPANTIVVHLPINGWTQRYVQTGCGGLCGKATINTGQASGCPLVEDGTLATATTDMGHQGQNDGSWAADNPQAQIDFAYRGVHLTALTAKALISKFYGQPATFSYFTGCSDGGREALMEAQRYPDDFDGIAAGAPANNMAVQTPSITRGTYWQTAARTGTPSSSPANCR